MTAQTITIKPADLAVGDVMTVFGRRHTVAKVYWLGGSRVWESDHEIAWNGKPAAYAIHWAVVEQEITVERAV